MIWLPPAPLRRPTPMLHQGASWTIEYPAGEPLVSDPLEMDWARDDAVLGPADLKQVFKFEPKETTVLRVLNQYNVS